MRTMRRMVRFQGAATALTALLVTGAVAGCSGSSEVTTTARPTASQSVQTHMPTTSVASQTVSPLMGEACGNDVAPMTLVRVDGQLKCLQQEELRSYEKILEDRARALLEPIDRSVGLGASPEAALRSLVALSCKQSLDNPYYWGGARSVYRNIISRANPEALVTKWPSDFSVAVRRGCY